MKVETISHGATNIRLHLPLPSGGRRHLASLPGSRLRRTRKGVIRRCPSRKPAKGGLDPPPPPPPDAAPVARGGSSPESVPDGPLPRRPPIRAPVRPPGPIRATLQCAHGCRAPEPPLLIAPSSSPPSMGDHTRDLAFPPPGHTLPRTSSMSVTDSVTAVHDFRVTGYSLLDGMGVGRYVSSRVFTVGGLDWAVRFYPDGSTATCVGNASAFLYYCSRDKDVRARFTLNLMERDGKLSQVTNASMKHTFSPASDNWGFIKFIEKSKIQGSPFLHNDCLTIRCLLTVAKESRTQDVETSSITVPPSNLQKDFENMLNDGEGADVTFDVGGQLFSAHRCVLAFRSPVFRAELFGPMKEKATQCIDIDDMEPLIFEALLHFIYTDSLPDDCKDGKAAAMQHLLVAADRYGVNRLRLLCESKLSETIDVQTVATTLALAEQHHCSQLRQACIQFMASPNMLRPVIETEGFKHLVASCPLIMKDILDRVSSIWKDKSSEK